MSFTFDGSHIQSYYAQGFCIFRDLIPASLLTDLRRMAEEGRKIAHDRSGPQAQRLQPIVADLDITPYIELIRMPVLEQAIRELFRSEDYHLGVPPGQEKALKTGILYNPEERPWCTQWHRDWRDNIPGLDIDVWRSKLLDWGMFNQVNCALYEDSCTWVVPGSHMREDLPEEVSRFPMRPIPGPDLLGTSVEQAELRCLQYCQSMPGAVQAFLNAGDFMLYRNSLWHIGNYLTYKRRATLHEGIFTEQFRQWFEHHPRRPDGSNAMMNPNLGTPQYREWAATQTVGG